MLLAIIIIVVALVILGAAVFWKIRRRGPARQRPDQLSREDQVSQLRNQQGHDARRGSRDGAKALGAGRGGINSGGWGP